MSKEFGNYELGIRGIGRVSLILLSYSTAWAAMLFLPDNVKDVKAESLPAANPQYIEILRSPAILDQVANDWQNGWQNNLQTETLSEALNNDDQIGEMAMQRYGCDCSGCRYTLSRTVKDWLTQPQ